MCNNFKPNVWGDTGPRAITRTLQTICNVTNVNDMKPEICSGFNVLPPNVFYPIYHSHWTSYFDADVKEECLKATKNSVAIHVWNKLSSQQPILKDFQNQTLVEKYGNQMKQKITNPFGETAYGIIAKANCPRAYESSGELF